MKNAYWGALGLVGFAASIFAVGHWIGRKHPIGGDSPIQAQGIAVGGGGSGPATGGSVTIGQIRAAITQAPLKDQLAFRDLVNSLPINMSQPGLVWQDHLVQYQVRDPDPIDKTIPPFTNPVIAKMGANYVTYGAEWKDVPNTTFKTLAPADNQNGLSRCCWFFDNLPPGTYRLSATWSPSPTYATQAIYGIEGSLQPQNVIVNQQVAPAGLIDADKVAWKDLVASLQVDGPSIYVFLTGSSSNGIVQAGGVRLEMIKSSGDPLPVKMPTTEWYIKGTNYYEGYITAQVLLAGKTIAQVVEENPGITEDDVVSCLVHSSQAAPQIRRVQ